MPALAARPPAPSSPPARSIRSAASSIAQALRHASATATPNIRVVTLADRLLGRSGRMVAAIETIGPGAIATEAVPFRLDLE
jgi:hypothetical protein